MRVPLACLLLAACTNEHLLSLDELPVEAWTGGLPVDGDGTLFVWLARANDDWSRAVGVVRFHCSDCRLGDGVAKLTLDGFDEGIPFPGIELGDVEAAVDFADGEVTLRSTWRSADFVLDAKVIGALAPRAEDIVLRGCVRFGPTAHLRERDHRMHALVVTTGAPKDADREMFSIEIGGTLGAMRRLGRVCSLAQVR